MTAHSTGQSPTVVTPCFTFFGGFTTQTRDMVVVSGGFRDRWQRQGLARQLDAENGQTDDLQQNLFGGCLEDQTGSPDESWNQVGFADVFESPAFDADDQSIAHMSFMDDSRSVFIKPKPKSRPQNSSSSSSSLMKPEDSGPRLPRLLVRNIFAMLLWKRSSFLSESRDRPIRAQALLQALSIAHLILEGRLRILSRMRNLAVSMRHW